MKTFLPLAALTLILVPAAFAGGGNATLQLALGSAHAPAYKTCPVALTFPTNGAAVLDAATASGCISGWDSVDYGTPGHPNRFVTCIDGLCQQEGTAWWYYVDGQQAKDGVDNANGGATVNAGDTVLFPYADWFTPCIDTPDLCGFLP